MFDAVYIKDHPDSCHGKEFNAEECTVIHGNPNTESNPISRLMQNYNVL